MYENRTKVIKHLIDNPTKYKWIFDIHTNSFEMFVDNTQFILKNTGDTALYEDYILEEYLKDLYLPARDCTLLDKEVQAYFNEAVNTLNQMRNYLRSIQGIDILEKHSLQLKETIHSMEEDLTTKKVLKKMQKKVIKTSKLLSSDINEYCRTLNCRNEVAELDRLYLDKLYDDKS